jgi:hypothetical protein
MRAKELESLCDWVCEKNPQASCPAISEAVRRHIEAARQAALDTSAQILAGRSFSDMHSSCSRDSWTSRARPYLRMCAAPTSRDPLPVRRKSILIYRVASSQSIALQEPTLTTTRGFQVHLISRATRRLSIPLNWQSGFT